MPIVARPLDVRPVVLWISAALIEEKTESNGKKETRYESTPRYFILFNFFFLFFLFEFFLEVLCGERVYVGRPPGVGVRPSREANKRKNVTSNPWNQEMGTRKVRRRSRFFWCFLFDLFLI